MHVCGHLVTYLQSTQHLPACCVVGDWAGKCGRLLRQPMLPGLQLLVSCIVVVVVVRLLRARVPAGMFYLGIL
jgi:hypothetical protein